MSARKLQQEVATLIVKESARDDVQRDGGDKIIDASNVPQAWDS